MSTSSTSGTALIQGTSYTSGAGIDVTATVDAIITGMQAPETAWKNDQTTITNQETALGALQTEVASVASSFQSLTAFDGVFYSVTANSSNTSALNVTASSTAASGDHKITISNLATTGASYSNGLSSSSSTITAGALTFKLGSGALQTINIPGDSTTDSNGNTTTSTTTTLTNAAAYINKQNAGVTASIVTDSNGSRLVLTSTASGSAASVSVKSAPPELSFTDVAGKDANLTVDGVPVVSSSNTLTSAISGVTLNLTGTSSSEIDVKVGPDADKITTAVNSFISAYNAAITDLNNQFQYAAGTSSGTATATSGVLETDSAARLTQAQLLAAISVVTSGNSTFKTLGSLGITMGNDGTLSLDSTTFSSALTNNFSDVKNFFVTTDSTSFSDHFTSMMNDMTDVVKSPIVLDLNSLKSTYSDDQKNIDDLEANLAVQRITLISKYSTLDALLKTFPSTMDQINTELGYNNSSSSSSSGT